MAALISELYVSDLDASLAFYTALGFRVRYRRPAEHFARVARGDAELMLEEPRGRTWLSASLDNPRGIGVNLQIATDAVEALFTALPSGIRPYPWARCRGWMWGFSSKHNSTAFSGGVRW